MPLFSMNVYDRVVPNNAVDTLWMMALGVLLIIGMDFAVRLLRGHFIDLAGARIDVQLSSRSWSASSACAWRATGLGRFFRLEPACLRIGPRLHRLGDRIGAHRPAVRADLHPRHHLDSWPLALIPLIALVIGLIYAHVVQHRCMNWPRPAIVPRPCATVR